MSTDRIIAILIIIGWISMLFFSISYTFKENKRSKFLYDKYKPLVDDCYDRDELNKLYDNLLSECTTTYGKRTSFNINTTYLNDFKKMLNILETRMDTIDKLKNK